MTQIIKQLNDKGQCCGRKPLAYKRPHRLYCPRCDAQYTPDGIQSANWAWTAKDGGFVKSELGKCSARGQDE